MQVSLAAWAAYAALWLLCLACMSLQRLPAHTDDSAPPGHPHFSHRLHSCELPCQIENGNAPKHCRHTGTPGSLTCRAGCLCGQAAHATSQILCGTKSAGRQRKCMHMQCKGAPVCGQRSRCKCATSWHGAATLMRIPAWAHVSHSRYTLASRAHA